MSDYHLLLSSFSLLYWGWWYFLRADDSRLLAVCMGSPVQTKNWREEALIECFIRTSVWPRLTDSLIRNIH